MIRENWKIDLGGASTLVVAGCTIWWVGIRPLFEERRLQQLRVDALQRLVAEAEVARGDRFESIAHLDQVRELHEHEAMTLERVGLINGRKHAILDLAANLGVDVEVIQDDDPDPQRDFTTVRIHLKGQASYAALTDLTRAISARFPDVKIDTLTITGNAASPDVPGLFVIDLTWYAAHEDHDDAPTDETA